jgi:hypothetical protein
MDIQKESALHVGRISVFRAAEQQMSMKAGIIPTS